MADCNAEKGRRGKKQKNTLMKAEFPVSGTVVPCNRENPVIIRITLFSLQDLPIPCSTLFVMQ